MDWITSLCFGECLQYSMCKCFEFVNACWCQRQIKAKIPSPWKEACLPQATQTDIDNTGTGTGYWSPRVSSRCVHCLHLNARISIVIVAVAAIQQGLLVPRSGLAQPIHNSKRVLDCDEQVECRHLTCAELHVLHRCSLQALCFELDGFDVVRSSTVAVDSTKVFAREITVVSLPRPLRFPHRVKLA